MDKSRLSNFIYSASTWLIAGNTYSVDGKDSGSHVTRYITASDLSTIDPRLPYAIAVLFKNQSSLHGGHVNLMLNMWRNTVFVRNGENRKVAVYNAYKAELDDKNQLVRFSGTVLEPNYFEEPALGDLSPVLYPGVYLGQSVAVPYSYMDEDYPDWMKRFDVAVSLGYNELTAVTNMLTSPKAPPTLDLPNISF